MGIFDEEEPSFFHKYRMIIGCVIAAAIAVAVWFGRRQFEGTSRPRQERNMVLVNLPAAPLPPPPAPSQLPPPTENTPKMMTQEPVNAMESKPDETPKDEPPANASLAVGTGIQGDGSPDGFGLRGGRSFFGGSTGEAVNRGSSSRWGWYASQVQGAISQALQGNNNTRTADFRIVAQIWCDRNGRITRARITGSTGNVALDNAITNEVLAGLVLQEPPPEGMPMPIILRLTARHSPVALSR